MFCQTLSDALQHGTPRYDDSHYTQGQHFLLMAMQTTPQLLDLPMPLRFPTMPSARHNRRTRPARPPFLA